MGRSLFSVSPLISPADAMSSAPVRSRMPVQFDGYRALLLKTVHGVQIRSRNDNDLTRQYWAVAWNCWR